MVKIVDLAHFFVHPQPIRPKSEKYFQNHILDQMSFLYSKSDIYIIPTEKVLYQNIEKRSFSWHVMTFEAISGFWGKNLKTPEN